MIRLHILVEGQTEERFVKELLVPHLWDYEVYPEVSIVTTSRDRHGKKRQGGGGWANWKGDLLRRLQENSTELRVTTFFDLYRLPRDFPRIDELASVADTATRVKQLERAMEEAINDSRFIPYVQRHEFEALVLAAGKDVLERRFPGRDHVTVIRALWKDIGHCNPEDVNDGLETAPSRRLKQIRPYHKVTDGVAIIRTAGLAAIRARCPRFDAWLTKLETLGAGS